MASKWKIIIPVIIIVIIIVVGYLQFSGKLPEVANTEPAPTKKVEATGNVDETVNIFLQDTASETTSLSQEADGDVDLVASDSQAISDFGQIYDENEF